MSLAVKLIITAFLIIRFMFKEPMVLVLYLIYRVMVLAIGRWPSWWRRLFRTNLDLPNVDLKPGRT